MLENNDKYFEVLNDIKKILITTRNKIVENANKDLVLMYSSLERLKGGKDYDEYRGHILVYTKGN
ncbi:MAG: hypothetical protein HFJ12_07605 [Bacilli bacterium]|nr:hypothetical protein [Bacilli bacterium]